MSEEYLSNQNEVNELQDKKKIPENKVLTLETGLKVMKENSRKRKGEQLAA